MAVIEYMKSLFASLGVTADRLPLVIAIIAALLAISLARPFFRRVGRVVEDLFFTNWQLALMGSTGLVLSLASGWTTWDGMRNFTGEPILSGMVTFGIQGVMLIVAWLIGESFATGMTQRMPDSRLAPKPLKDDVGLRLALGFMLAGIAMSLIAGVVYLGRATTLDLDGVPRILGFVGIGVLIVGLLIVAARAHTLQSYFAATRVMIRTAMLWLMFLACMATSVFFSFDSLFTTIFPQSERVRAAELRAQNQVAGIVSDIGNTIVRSQLKESERLFASDGWIAYDAQLAKLGRAAQASQGEIERYFQTQMEDRRRSIAEQQERIATAQGGQAGLSQKKISLTDELARLKGERPALAEDFGARKGDVELVQRELDAKRVEAMAEARGVEGTGKQGEGPMFRQRKAEEDGLRDKLKITEERLKNAQQRFTSLTSRLTAIERELSLIDGDIAKYKGEAQTAEQRIKLAQEAKVSDEGPKVDPSRMLPLFEKARAEFRQTPKVELLGQVQQMCTQLYAAMLSAPTTKERVRDVDCDPKTAAEAAGRVFALNTGIVAFEMSCAGGDKLAQHTTADALFGFSRKCVQDSGLGSKETEEMRQKINGIELNRDDKANRFVVTWNAFQDGNRLAYLALAIAIAIDSMVFLSGLHGANAVRSPLSDVPSYKARTADQLEKIIDNSLVPHRFENARIAIDAMNADTSRSGYSAVVNMAELDPQSAAVVRKVLNAGASIGAVHRDELDSARYFVRPELFEYLSISGAKAFERHGGHVEEDIAEKVRLHDLEKMVAVELVPDIEQHAATVMEYTHPMNADDAGFMSEIVMSEVDPSHQRLVRGVLNAGASHRAVRRQKGESVRYEIHSDLYKVLARLRVRGMMSTSQVAIGARGTAEGGAIRGPSLAGASPQQLQLGQQGAAPRSGRESPDATTISAVTQFQNEFQGDGARAPAMNNQPMGSPAGDPFDQAMYEQFASAIGYVQASSVQYVVENVHAMNLPQLEAALSDVLRCDPDLRSRMLDAKRALVESINEAYGSFNFRNPPADAQHRLIDMRDCLLGATAVIVLLENQVYQNLIEELAASLDEDHGAGRLSGTEATMRQLVRVHLKQFKDARLTEDHWGAITASLTQFGRGLFVLASSDKKQARMG